MKKAIVTGATKVVGVALIEYLVSKGVFVYAICKENSQNISNIKKHDLVKIIECDMSKYKDLFIDSNVDVFYHLAWDKTNDIYIQNKNILYTLDACNLAYRCNASCFICAGSQSEYGNSCKVKKETDICHPASLYATAKHCAYYMSKIYCKSLKIRHIWTRIFSVYGAYNENSMLYEMFLNMKENKTCNLTNCDQLWNYVYSKDVAYALYELFYTNYENKIYNIASKNSYELKTYLLKMKSILKSRSKLNFGVIDYYENQSYNLNASVKNLENDINYKEKYSFKDGILDMLNN